MRLTVLIGLLVLISACNAVPQVIPNPDQTTIPGTIRNAYGETIAWPPEVDTPDSDEVTTLAASDLGCVSPTGPIRRVYTLANQNVNYLSSTVTLPAASAITNVPADSTAYVYSGGASNTD